MYVSTSSDPSPDTLLQIYNQSRHNNAIDGVTGLLWSDGARFLQVLEGSEPAVAETFERITRDERHRDLHVIFERYVSQREFGDWAMGLRRSDETADEFDRRMRQILDRASVAVREGFMDLVATG